MDPRENYAGSCKLSFLRILTGIYEEVIIKKAMWILITELGPVEAI